MNLLNITNGESSEETRVNLLRFLGLSSSGEISLWNGSWLRNWFRDDLLDNFFNDWLLFWDSLSSFIISGGSLGVLLATALLFGEGSL